MQGSDPKNDAAPIIMILERRSQRQDLSSADVMKILRKRAALRSKANDN
jgi:hypothetical protein